jgi:hypothetical protein
MNRLRVGDKVKINKELISEKFKSMNKDILDNEFEISHMVVWNGELMYLLAGIPDFSEWQGVGIEGKMIERQWVFSKHKLIKSITTQKTNKIRRTQTGSIIEHKIDNMDLCFEITNNPMNLRVALNLLLHETELYNFKYERVSPFKITKEYNKDKQGHIFTIDFIDIRSKENVSTELLRTDRAMRLDGKYKIFIPDFLEICTKLGILERNEKGYKLIIHNLSNVMNGCEYINEKSLEKELESKGYLIPKGWNRYK